jgi:hypothetical protein
VYPEVEPYETGMLDAGDGQQVYWELCGNPDGKPALAVHGGPARRAHLGFEPGLLTLLVRLVVRRLAPWWSPVLVLLGFVPIAVNPDLLPLGALVLLAGLVPVASLKVSGEPARVDGWRSRERSRW